MTVRPHSIITSRIARPRRHILYGVALGLWLTGVIWLLSHDVFIPEGDFGPVYRPVDAWLLTAHGALSFAAFWFFGLLWGVHITVGWAHKRRRGSGAILFAAVTFLCLTGYLLYYTGNEDIRAIIAVLHWSLGIFALGIFIFHQFVTRLRRRAR